MTPITINQLAAFVKKQQQLGNGNKFLLMSSDDECNEYHPAWEGMDDGAKYVDVIDSYQVRGGVNLKDCVILV